jgi:2-oxoglutarate ferredoxin oxidoreductase subunit alpha
MCHLRAQKVANVADDIPLQEVDGPESGDLVVLSWGGPYGACATAVHTAQAAGKKVAHCHLRYLNPFPKNLEQILRSYKHVLIPELNLGQLSLMIRSKFLIDAISLNKIQGKPFSVHEIVTKIDSLVA